MNSMHGLHFDLQLNVDTVHSTTFELHGSFLVVCNGYWLLRKSIVIRGESH